MSTKVAPVVAPAKPLHDPLLEALKKKSCWGFFAITAPDERGRSHKTPVRLDGDRIINTPAEQVFGYTYAQATDMLAKRTPEWIARGSVQRQRYFEKKKKTPPAAIVGLCLGITCKGDVIPVDLDGVLDPYTDQLKDGPFKDLMDSDALKGVQVFALRTVSQRGLRLLLPWDGPIAALTTAERHGIGFLTVATKGFTINLQDQWLGHPRCAATLTAAKAGAPVLFDELKKLHGAPTLREDLKARAGAMPLEDFEKLTVENMISLIRHTPNVGLPGDIWAPLSAGYKWFCIDPESDELKEAWLEWCLSAEDNIGPHDTEANADRWDRFTPPTDIGMGTLFHYARGTPEMAAPVEDLKARVTSEEEIKARFLRVSKVNKVYDRYTREVIDWGACADHTIDLRMLFVGADGVQETQPHINSRVFWLKKNLYPCDGVFWDPRLPEVGTDACPELDGTLTPAPDEVWFNTYRPVEVPVATHKEFRPWLNHLQFLYPVGWEEVLSALAWMVQRPGQNLGWVPVLNGPEGIGKDAILRPLVKATRAIDLSFSKFEGGFDGGLFQRTTAVLQEVEITSKMSAADISRRIKDIAASPPYMLALNPKFGHQKFDVPNVINAVATTNHPEHLAISRNERRAAVLPCSVPSGNRAAVLAATAKAQALREWLDAGGIYAVMEMLSLHKWWLASGRREEEHRLPFPAWASAEVERLMRENMGPVAEWIEEEGVQEGVNVVSTRMLREAYNGANFGRPITAKDAGKALSVLGWRWLKEHNVRAGKIVVSHQLWGRGEESDEQLIARFDPGPRPAEDDAEGV